MCKMHEDIPDEKNTKFRHLSKVKHTKFSFSFIPYKLLLYLDYCCWWNKLPGLKSICTKIQNFVTKSLEFH